MAEPPGAEPSFLPRAPKLGIMTKCQSLKAHPKFTTKIPEELLLSFDLQASENTRRRPTTTQTMKRRKVVFSKILKLTHFMTFLTRAGGARNDFPKKNDDN